MTEFYYHGTSDAFLDRMLSKGLLLTHWTKDWELAVHFADHMWEWDAEEYPDCKPIVFAVPVEHFDGVRRQADLNMLHSGASTDPKVQAELADEGFSLDDWIATFLVTGTFITLDPMPVSQSMVREAIAGPYHRDIVKSLFQAHKNRA